MCAKRTVNFALWQTILLSFETRFFLLETVLQMLLIYLSTVTPSRQCFKTFSVGGDGGGGGGGGERGRERLTDVLFI